MQRVGFVFLVLCATAHADPLADFEVVVNRCKGAFDARPLSDVVNMPSMNLWIKRVYGPSKVVYDVRKTDSLVSPFVAKIEISEVVASGRTKDEEQTKALDISLEKEGNRFHTQVNFTYQKGVWEVVDGKESMQPGIVGGGTGQVNILTRERVLASKGPIKNCFSAN